MPFNLKQLVPGFLSKRAENGTASSQRGGRSASTCEGDPYGDGSEVRIRLSSEASGQYQSSRRCSRRSDVDYDDGYGCIGTIVVTLLILSPPLVLVGVILLTTGAILSSAHVFGSGMAVIVAGVVVGALSAFAFVRLRSHPSPGSSAGRAASLHRESAGQHRQLTPRTASIIETTDQRTVEITFCTTDAETTRDL
ncbi:uncharacterized protein LOC119737095 [Patiria miniata]|uniref:Uncharacterized protein n=1 Tax=Patiria miniata TaxID=46514 RepID=A0A914ATI9_PATMI|nr:uncharacterized protein LOC119737052 [Patiria miniata]XP_038067087.1 uncharacterized protein LOC119737076 [Patiria miniata]XP_038067114.1 uncharacterized protein LOC119737095 [Patiria miniata]